MKPILVSSLAALALAAPLMAQAKLPAPDDAAKAKAAEAAAKTAWQGKVDAFQLCKSQDRVAAHYKKGQGKAAAKPAAGASAAAALTIAPCADPGPFVYTPPAAPGAPAAAAAPAPAAPAKKS